MMFLKPTCPVGVNPPSSEDRKPIWQAYSGNDLTLTTRITLVDGKTPVTPENSQLKFELANTQFDCDALWEGEWMDGITPVDLINHPGLIKIKIPEDVGNCLRRGGYRFSLLVSNIFGKDTYTPLVGTLLIEYTPTSPNHDIPYNPSCEESSS